MADAQLTVGVQVALSVDESTAVWLESQGWTRPPTGDKGAAQRLYMQLLSELDPPNDRLLKLLEYFGVDMSAFLEEQQGIGVEENDDYDPLPMELSVMSDIAEVEEALPAARPLRAMGGAEAMRHRAARLRRDLMNEVSSPERVDEMLRNLDVNVEALAAVDCDC
ncbi:hypothetical protein SEA_LIZZ_6 [Streptomyces phage Lizz]|nr:hypothetical protein SEA_LIZZ_6 [Streptomyces phage Lizz]